MAKKPNIETPSWVSIETTGDRAWTITISPSSGTTPETYSAAVRATDARGRTDDEPFTITVSCPTLTLDPIADVDVEVNEGFTRTARATGGCEPITITVTGQPTGVTIESVNARTKRIGSTGLSAPGTHTVTVEAEDARGTTTNKNFTITVRPRPPRPPLTVTCPSDKTVSVGASISLTVRASGGTPPYTFSELSIDPSGLTLDIPTDASNERNRTIEGTAPSSAGEYTVTVTVNDDASVRATCDFMVTIINDDCDVEVGGLPTEMVTETVCEAINPIQASVYSDCPPPYTFSMDRAPSEVTIIERGEEAGRISGIPTETGTFTVEVTARAGNRGAGNSRFRTEGKYVRL